MAKIQKVKKVKLSLKDEDRCIALMDQLDVLVTALCDVCCVTNYYKTQRALLVKQLFQICSARLAEVSGINIEYDITGSNYAQDDSDVPLTGDSVVLSLYCADGDTLIEWDGHLKHHLRGVPSK